MSSLSSFGFDFFCFRHGFRSRSKRVEGGRGEGSGRRKQAADLGRGGFTSSQVASHALGAALGEHPGPNGPTTVAFTKASKAINSWTHRPKQFNEFWQPLRSPLCMVEVSDGFADSKQESYSGEFFLLFHDLQLCKTLVLTL